MRKIREILRLYYSCHLSVRQISQSCKVSRPAITGYLNKVKTFNLSWPLPENLSDEDLDTLLFPTERKLRNQVKTPDWEYVCRELKRKGVTRQILWEEYIEKNPDGISYSLYCTYLREWLKKQDVTMRIVHKAGEKVFVDYAGPTVSVTTDQGIINAQIFIAVCGASNYTYVEATASQNLNDWTSSHVRAFKFFGGTPQIIVTDNLKSGVTKADYYEPDINRCYHELAKHYDLAVIPARSRKPKDKAKVEGAVLIAERWILARIRDEQFFSLVALNKRISELLKEFNQRPFQKMNGSRASMFEEIERHELKALPEIHYEFADFKIARVNVDYHIEYKNHYYSVPYQYVRNEVTLRVTAQIIEIFAKNVRIASHFRSNKKGAHTTIPEHMPKKHQDYATWTPERISQWANKVGPATSELTRRIIESRQHPQQGFRSCFGLLRLEESYSAARLEVACERALMYGTYTYQSVKSMLKSGFDKKKVNEQPVKSIQHENIRGQSILQ